MTSHTDLPPAPLDADASTVERPEPGDLRAAAEALGERLFGSALATLELATVHLGLRLGLYETIQRLGSVSSRQLAADVHGDERYVREWLEQQAVAELLSCPNADARPEERHYELPPATAMVLLETATPAYLGPVSHLAVGTLLAVPAVEEAFRLCTRRRSGSRRVQATGRGRAPAHRRDLRSTATVPHRAGAGRTTHGGGRDVADLIGFGLTSIDRSAPR